ncbi:uncharacterized protein LOC126654659 [Mercurialis annua]|uniref:uncharacterized protein LOC126654659 n=1 Tax=Mercurialis annua TaxID=3986 RepID=UPI002160A8D6|nr:uncharacterized protein LOC126654659 [Mercurialis annua]
MKERKMENGLVSVDKWSEKSQAYFLTHLHADHTQGLTSTWSKGPLFCSQLTAHLFPSRFPGFNLSLLTVLDTGLWHSMRLVSPSSGSQTTLQVMPIDAHHCPGAVMFLFRGDFGCLLFTGDFRWEAECESAKTAREMLVDALKDNAVDVLYLDNTYCNPAFEFPPRLVAARQVVDIIDSHPGFDIIIGIDSLGKEDLLVHISDMLETKIWVWPERLQTMHLLGFHDIFTTRTSLTSVRAVPRYSFSIDTLNQLNTMHPTIGIMPSGLPWMVKSTKGNSNKSQLSTGTETGTEKIVRGVERCHEYMYIVPYSDHSCFSEIKEFVELVRPTSMKGIVSSSSSYVEPFYYFGGLCGERPISQNEHENKERDERVIDIQTKSFCGIHNTIQSRSMKPVGVSRVTALRRVSRGSKLAENDSSD